LPYTEGIIARDPYPLQDEEQDADWPLMLALIILVFDAVGLIVAFGVIALVIIIVLLIVSAFVSMWVGNQFGRLLSALFGGLTWLLRRLFHGGHDPDDRVRVLEYQLENATGNFDIFRVKGDVERAFMRSNRVRIWATARQHRFYFVRGEIQTENGWLPVRRTVRRDGWYWLLGVIALNIVAYVLYATYLTH